VAGMAFETEIVVQMPAESKLILFARVRDESIELFDDSSGPDHDRHN
jgi:hypothetical protein